MLVSTKNMLRKAQRGSYAVAAFNIDNLEMLKSVTQAAVKLRSPIIIATSESSLRYAGPGYLKAMINVAAQNTIPIALHVDHGKDLSLIRTCINTGWTSVMIDGSDLPYSKNVAITKKVVAMARPKSISVEGEIGMLNKTEDLDDRQASLTDPDQAVAFARASGVDSLAIALGTSHGPFKAAHAVRLDYARLKKIRSLVSIPLVLHGASSVPQRLKKMMHTHCRSIHDCSRLEGAHGTSIQAIQKAIKLGIAKVNVGTDMRAAFVAGLRGSLFDHKTVSDERILFDGALVLMQSLAEEKIVAFGSARKA